MTLVAPAEEHLRAYVALLESGWSYGPINDPQAVLERIRADPARYLALMTDREAKGDPVKLPDGSTVPRLPGLTRWMWDGEFCGAIGLRWQPGTEALPEYTLGHIGYDVLPGKRLRGYATRALAQMLPLAWAEGLRYVELTTDPDNIGSQKVIQANGGVLHERFTKSAHHGSTPGLRFRIQAP